MNSSELGSLKLWARAIALFSEQQLHLLPYSLKLVAPLFTSSSLNSIDAVLVIGRWQHIKTCRLYVEDGRLTLANLSLEKKSKQFLCATATPLRRQLRAAPQE